VATTGVESVVYDCLVISSTLCLDKNGFFVVFVITLSSFDRYQKYLVNVFPN